MKPFPVIAALLVLLVQASGCYVVEVERRDLPPRRTAPSPRAAAPAVEPPPAPTEPTGTFHVPPDRVPPADLCRIWYDELPPDRQPAPMTCARAHRVARNHGGRVIWAESEERAREGEVASVEYGPVDLHGVPPDRLPPPGYCRVWVEGVPPDRQPPPARCPEAEREAQKSGGRLLYMPSTDVPGQSGR